MVAKHSLMARMARLESLTHSGLECIYEFKKNNCETVSESKTLSGVKLTFADMADEEALTDEQVKKRRTIRAKYSQQNQPPRVLQEFYQ